MPVFAYKAKGQGGQVTEGLVEADQVRGALDRLRAQKLVVLEIGEKKEGIFGPIKKLISQHSNKIATKDLTIFSRQLSTLVSAGMPIVQGLLILETQIENKAFGAIIGNVRSDIESGLSITEAMKKHPDVFPELYTSMVKAGELGGILDIILDRLSGYLESAEELRAKVKGAMMYPIIVLSICFAVTIFLLTFVIPTFKTIFAEAGAVLPMPTRILLGISDLLKKFFIVVLLAPVAAYKGLQKYYKTLPGQKKIDGLLLKAPIFGPLLKKVAVSKFTRTLGTLIKSGVPIMQALETVASTAGNYHIAAAINASRDSIREGGHLSDPLKKSGIFPNMVTSMISVGEQTGNLDVMLQKIADFYDMEVNEAVKGLTSMIEPIVIVVMGVIIGSIVVAMFLPMFNMGSLAGEMAK